MKKVGPNIRCHVNTLTHQALGTKRGHAEKCNMRGCKTCRMLLLSPTVTIRNKKVKLAHGSCKTPNICYLALCDICGKPYTGQTVEEMHLRINGHRSLYKDVLERSEANTLEEIDSNTDQYTLGLHLHLEHGLNDPNAFDNHMKFGILEIVNPNDIAKKE